MRKTVYSIIVGLAVIAANTCNERNIPIKDSFYTSSANTGQFNKKIENKDIRRYNQLVTQDTELRNILIEEHGTNFTKKICSENGGEISISQFDASIYGLYHHNKNDLNQHSKKPLVESYQILVDMLKEYEPLSKSN